MWFEQNKKVHYFSTKKIFLFFWLLFSTLSPHEFLLEWSFYSCDKHNFTNFIIKFVCLFDFYCRICVFILAFILSLSVFLSPSLFVSFVCYKNRTVIERKLHYRKVELCIYRFYNTLIASNIIHCAYIAFYISFSLPFFSL